MKIVVTRAADLDQRGISCRRCMTLLASYEKKTDTHTPTVEQLVAADSVPVPNFGWFCGQACADAYSREQGIAFQRDTTGKVSYY